VLEAVRRRLDRERWARHARQAAWGCVVIALLAVLVHLWVRPLEVEQLLAAIALPWLLAALQSRLTRPTRAECAQWADQHLAGRSGYAALLEFADSPAATRAPAVAHLEAWLDEPARRSLATLDARPLETGLAKPLAAALVCSALAAALLQLPTHPLATPLVGRATGATAIADHRQSAAQPTPRSPRAEPAARAEDARGKAMTTQQPGARIAPTAAAPPPSQAASLERATEEVRDRPPGARSVARDTATGREAGDSADTGDDALLVAPSQESLVARLREISPARAPAAGRADPAQATDYASAGAAAGTSPASIPLAAPAADPPPATARLELGPAEQGYLRAYWADTGARP